MQPRVRRPASGWTLLLASLVLAACGGSGNHVTPGADPQGTVTIKRDRYGVPHVYARDTYGLFYGYAYAIAEDRLFQLDMMRRAIMGTTAEVLGPGENGRHVAFDRAARANLRPELIEQQLAALKGEERDIFLGYANGINDRIRAVLASRQRHLPKQYLDLDFDPTPWTMLDVAMIWVGSAAARYSDANGEIGNLRLLNSLESAHGKARGRQIFDQLRWPNDPHAVTTVPRDSSAPPKGGARPSASQSIAPSIELLRTLEQLDVAKNGGAGPDFAPRASNVWIAAPARTQGGDTVFINGPQQGFTNPSYVTGAGLHGAGFDVVGNTPLGWPYLVFATNGVAAWGATAGPLDVVDMYRLTLDPDNPRRYLYKGAYRDMGRRVETISVKGAAPEHHEVLTSVHGLVTGLDATKGVAYAKRRSWEGIEIPSLLAFIKSMKAKSWEQFLAASEPIGISNNRYYADSSGNIGYVSVGRIPIRPDKQDFRLPADGNGTMEWLGFHPFNANPKSLNPSQGYLSNWNNQPSAMAGSTDVYFWSSADRVNELNVQFEQKARFSIDELWDFNAVASYMDVDLRYFKPFIVQALATMPDSPARRAGQLVADWDGMTRDPQGTGYYDHPAVPIFRAWLAHMVKRTLQADVPPEQLAQLTNVGVGTNVSMGVKVTYNALMGENAGVRQLVDFFRGADKNRVIADALEDTVAQLSASSGADMNRWRAPVRPHVFGTSNFLGIPQAATSERLSMPVAQNRGTQNHRVVFDRSGKASMCDVAPPGQSGFVAPDGRRSPHYDDQLALYGRFGCKPQWINGMLPAAEVGSETTLSYKR